VYSPDRPTYPQDQAQDFQPSEPAQTTERQASVDLGLLDELTDGLAQVQAALERLDAGTYGRCAHCGDPIGDDMLEASPTATLCAAPLPFRPAVAQGETQSQM